MLEKIELYKVAVASTSFLREAYLDFTGKYSETPAIRFTYEQNGLVREDGIAFKHVAASRHRVERCCKKWHIEKAYDTLVVIPDSPWSKEIFSDTNDSWKNKWQMNHYMIYLDSAGCFEFIADSWFSILADLPS